MNTAVQIAWAVWSVLEVIGTIGGVALVLVVVRRVRSVHVVGTDGRLPILWRKVVAAWRSYWDDQTPPRVRLEE